MDNKKYTGYGTFQSEKGEYTGIREFRKHLAYYTKGLPNSSEFRCKINELESKEEVMTALDEYYNSNRA